MHSQRGIELFAMNSGYEWLKRFESRTEVDARFLMRHTLLKPIRPRFDGNNKTANRHTSNLSAGKHRSNTQRCSFFISNAALDCGFHWNSQSNIVLVDWVRNFRILKEFSAAGETFSMKHHSFILRFFCLAQSERGWIYARLSGTVIHYWWLCVFRNSYTTNNELCGVIVV